MYQVQTGDDIIRYFSLPDFRGNMSEPVSPCWNEWKVGRKDFLASRWPLFGVSVKTFSRMLSGADHI